VLCETPLNTQPASFFQLRALSCSIMTSTSFKRARTRSHIHTHAEQTSERARRKIALLSGVPLCGARSLTISRDELERERATGLCKTLSNNLARPPHGRLRCRLCVFALSVCHHSQQSEKKTSDCESRQNRYPGMIIIYRACVSQPVNYYCCLLAIDMYY
jgi:hypothetical protein